MSAADARIQELPSPQAVLPQARLENFTVANALLGRERVRELMAIYGFARLVDDVGDEVAGDRGALLELVESELRSIYGGGTPEHPIMVELAATIRGRALPQGPFLRLIEANRMDQSVNRYQTFEQLLGYCQLSAAPVGELVLGVFGAASPERIALSDRVCNALQIVEHLQDIAEDHGRDRIYMPREDLDRFGCEEADLAGPPSAAVRALIAFETARARSLLGSGAPLARTLPGRQRIAVAGFVAGGRRALDGLDAVVAGGSLPAGSAGRRRRRVPSPWQVVRAMAGR